MLGDLQYTGIHNSYSICSEYQYMQMQGERVSVVLCNLYTAPEYWCEGPDEEEWLNDYSCRWLHRVHEYRALILHNLTSRHDCCEAGIVWACHLTRSCRSCVLRWPTQNGRLHWRVGAQWNGARGENPPTLPRVDRTRQTSHSTRRRGRSYACTWHIQQWHAGLAYNILCWWYSLCHAWLLYTSDLAH